MIAHAKGRRMERMLLAARRKGGNEALERLYLAIGEAHHGRREDLNDESVVAACLKDAGLPGSLYQEALADESTEVDLMAEHEDSVERLHAFGVPTLALEGSDIGVFGPVIEPVPTGNEALELWDHTLWLLQSPAVWEFKRQARVKLGPQHVID
ncbi:MAG TPA: DsbA family protein [Chloroflexota bacterium]|nr:DsbA family protein [Chloroflexota bacterium]